MLEYTKPVNVCTCNRPTIIRLFANIGQMLTAVWAYCKTLDIRRITTVYLPIPKYPLATVFSVHSARIEAGKKNSILAANVKALHSLRLTTSGKHNSVWLAKLFKIVS
jgi:hypothetical protein